MLAKMATQLPVPDYDLIRREDVSVCGSLFNVVHGWFVASFGGQEATVGNASYRADHTAGPPGKSLCTQGPQCIQFCQK